jgi:hypothetical protein
MFLISSLILKPIPCRGAREVVAPQSFPAAPSRGKDVRRTGKGLSQTISTFAKDFKDKIISRKDAKKV